MLKKWKTSLIAAGVLATLLAGSAFAATEAEDAAIQQEGLEHNTMVEQQASNTEKGRPPFHMGKDGQHRPGPRHGEFHKHPGGPGPHHDGEFRGPHGGPGMHRVNPDRVSFLGESQKRSHPSRQAEQGSAPAAGQRTGGILRQLAEHVRPGTARSYRKVHPPGQRRAHEEHDRRGEEGL